LALFPGARPERKTAGRERNVALDGAMGRMPKSAGFRRNPREHAGVGAIGQEKTPTENGWGFDIGGAGGNRTRVRKSSATSSTCVVTSLSSRCRYADAQAQPTTSHLFFSSSPSSPTRHDSV